MLMQGSEHKARILPSLYYTTHQSKEPHMLTAKKTATWALPSAALKRIDNGNAQ